VLDSSVLVPRWSRFVLQELASATHRLFTPVWSEWIIAETWRVLAWRWRTRASALDEVEWGTLTSSANAMLRHLLPVMRLVSQREFVGLPPWPELRDPDDIPIWDTAVAAGAPHAVSHNVTDFPPLVDGRHVYGGVEYLTAIEFVADVLGADAVEYYGAPLPARGLVRSRRAR
jgi:hypothetical protein